MNAKDNNKRKLVARRELAKRLEMSPKTIDRWAKAGILEPIYHKLGANKGRVVWYDWHDVCRALKIKP